MSDERFDAIYLENRWNGVETGSGPGSGSVATRLVGPRVAQLVADLGARTVLDLGCGEGTWQPDLPGYLGMDVSARALERAAAHHPERAYQLDNGASPLPRAELVLCRDVMQHLSLEDGLRLLERVRESGATWLLASTYMGGDNVNIDTGEASYSPDLEQPPFALRGRSGLIFDGYHYHEHGSRAVRDERKYLGLWRL